MDKILTVVLDFRERRTYASSKFLIASKIPSAPVASAPYGRLGDPDMLLSSDTLSDSSLQRAKSDN